jgi:hypothetical protein
VDQPARPEAQRSIPAAIVIPVLVYADVREAVRWLSDAFAVCERTPEHGG